MRRRRGRAARRLSPWCSSTSASLSTASGRRCGSGPGRSCRSSSPRSCSRWRSRSARFGPLSRRVLAGLAVAFIGARPGALRRGHRARALRAADQSLLRRAARSARHRDVRRIDAPRLTRRCSARRRRARRALRRSRAGRGRTSARRSRSALARGDRACCSRRVYRVPLRGRVVRRAGERELRPSGRAASRRC